MPETVRDQIGKSFAHVFGEVPPAAHNVLDGKLVEEGTRRAHTAQLEQKVVALQQELAAQAASQADGDDTPPWDGDGAAAPIELRMPAEKAARIHTEVVDGQKCLLIPLDGDETARINGEDTPL